MKTLPSQKYYLLSCFILSIIIVACNPNVSEQAEGPFEYDTPESKGLIADSLANIDDLFNLAVEDEWLAGAVALVAVDGSIVYEKAFGYRNISEQDSMETTDIFRIASMSKPITSLAILQLQEAGKLNFDDPLSRNVLKAFIADHPNLELVGECKDALDAMRFLEKHSIDLLFLDINMPKLSGVNFYKSLQYRPEVIFTTAYAKFAVEGFELNAIDYLMKPIAFERFLQAIQKVKDKMGMVVQENSGQDHIMLKSDKKIYRTPYENILFCEALGDYVKVHLTDKVLIVTTTMKKLQSELPNNLFLRTHKSYLINTSKVEYLEGNQIKIGACMVAIGQSIFAFPNEF